MRTSRLLFSSIVVLGACVSALAISCGTPCADDRCSLTPASPQVTRVDYTNPKSTGTTSTTSSGGSGAPPASGSGSGSAVAASAGSGSAKPVATPVAAAGSGSSTGSAAPPTPATPAAPVSASGWELWSGNQFKMYVISKTAVAANAKVSLEFVKTPTKTPFVVTLEVLPPGGAKAAEAVWNDCPENKIRCDSAGTKTHAVKQAGQVLIQAGINWTVTSVADDSKGTLVTWTNNLSREVFSLRLTK